MVMAERRCVTFYVFCLTRFVYRPLSSVEYCNFGYCVLFRYRHLCYINAVCSVCVLFLLAFLLLITRFSDNIREFIHFLASQCDSLIDANKGVSRSSMN